MNTYKGNDRNILFNNSSFFIQNIRYKEDGMASLRHETHEIINISDEETFQRHLTILSYILETMESVILNGLGCIILACLKAYS